MKDSKLQISVVEHQRPPVAAARVSKAARRQEIQATLDRMWKQNPRQFDPNRDCVQRKRIKETMGAMRSHVALDSAKVADVGCGGGELSRLMRDCGASVDAVDVSNLALSELKSKPLENITPIQDCLPNTLLADNAYDLVVCTEMIGYLKQQEYRMVFSELARVVKAEGHVVFSTPLDIDSENALERLVHLAETEFEIDFWALNYDLLWLRLCRFFETPKFYAEAADDTSLRTSEAGKRTSIRRTWFLINTTTVLGAFWKAVSFLSKPLCHFVRQSAFLMNRLESVTRFLWSEAGISHALFIGKRRKMTYPLPPNEQPKEMKHKRQVWE